jgi:uroporphyrinogen decarboxylase
MESLLVDMMEHPAFVHDLLDAILDFNLSVIKEACRFDIDGFRFGDDWGCQRGLIMGPESWRAFLKPRLEEMYRTVHEAHKKVFIHSCGRVQDVFPELVEIGLDVFNPFQPEVMDIYEMKKAYYGRLAFFGGISVQRLLPFGTPDEVQREVRSILGEIGRGGGYIAAPSHAVPADVPVENLVAMIDVVAGQSGWRK